MIKIFSLTVFVLATIYSCKNNPAVPDSPAVSFQTDIQPVIIGNCTQSNCHGSSSGNDHAFPLVTYSDVTGSVEAGNANNSRLFTSIKNGSMPPASYSQPTDHQLKLIYVWIEQGAKNN